MDTKAIRDVFRYRVLLRKILSFTSYNPEFNILFQKSQDSHYFDKHSYQYKVGRKYREWNQASKMIEARQFGLLKDKLETNRYIQFDNKALEQLLEVNGLDMDIFQSIYRIKRDMFLSPQLISQAMKGGNLEIVVILLSQTHPIKLTPLDAWEVAASLGRTDFIDLLIELNVECDKDVQSSVVHRALANQQGTLYRYLCRVKKEWVDNYFRFAKRVEWTHIKCGDLEAIKRILPTPLTSSSDTGGTVGGKIPPILSYIHRYRYQCHLPHESQCAIIEFLCAHSNITLDLKQARAKVKEKFKHWKEMPLEVEDKLTVVEAMRYIVNECVSGFSFEWVVGELLTLNHIELVPYIMELSINCLPFEVVCELGTLEQVQCAVESMGSQKLISGTAMFNVLGRGDPESDLIMDFILTAFGIDTLTELRKSYSHTAISSKLHLSSLSKIKVFHTLVGSNIGNYVSIGNLTMDQLEYIVVGSQEWVATTLTSHKCINERLKQLEHAILMNDFPMIRYFLSVVGGMRPSQLSSLASVAITYNRYDILDKLILEAEKYNDRHEPFIFSGSAFNEMGKRGDYYYLDKYLMSNIKPGSETELVRGFTTGAISTGQTAAIGFILDKMVKSKNLQIQLDMDNIIRCCGIDTVNMLKQRGGKVHLIKDYIITAIRYGRIDMLRFFVNDGNTTTQNGEVDDKKVVAWVSKNILQESFLLNVNKSESIEMLWYLYRNGFGFRPLRLTNDEPFGKVTKDICDRMEKKEKKFFFF